jgi:hypothetical protein
MSKYRRNLLSIASIVSELKAERTRIDKALIALEGLSSNGAATAGNGRRKATVPSAPKRNRLSPAGRKRLSEMMKRRWAERRTKAAAKK